jgi:hypothetical protein
VNESIDGNKLLTNEKRTDDNDRDQQQQQAQDLFVYVCVLIKKTLVMMVKGKRREREREKISGERKTAMQNQANQNLSIDSRLN